MFVRCLCTSMLLLLTAVPVLAQDATASLFLGTGLSLPVGPFADPLAFNVTSAGVGQHAAIGADFPLPRTLKGLSFRTSALFSLFGTEDEQPQLRGVPDGATGFEQGRWRTFSLHVGFRYTRPFQQLGLFAESQAGVSTVRAPEVTSTGGRPARLHIDAVGVLAITGEFGGGVTLADRFDLGIRYALSPVITYWRQLEIDAIRADGTPTWYFVQSQGQHRFSALRLYTSVKL